MQQEAQTPLNENLQTIAEIAQCHYAPIQAALLNEAAECEWKREIGDIQSCQDMFQLHRFSSVRPSSDLPNQFSGAHSFDDEQS